MIEELKRPNCDDPDNVLDKAKGTLERVIIIGEDKDGNCYHAASFSYRPLMLWMVAEFVKRLMK